MARDAVDAALDATQTPIKLPSVSLTSPPTVTLEAAVSVLARLHVRHKNQHRVAAYWWAPFGQLRRHAAKLHAELVGGDSTCLSPTAIERARWIQVNLVPKAYLAFSRLITDRQFASIGLALLGVLAQIHAVIKSIVPKDPRPKQSKHTEEHDKEATAPAGNMANEPAETALLLPAVKDVDNGNDDDDLGVPVAREEELTGNDKENTLARKDTKKKHKAPMAPMTPLTQKRPRPEDAHDSDSDGVPVSRSELAKPAEIQRSSKKKRTDGVGEAGERPANAAVEKPKKDTDESRDGEANEKKHKRGKKDKKDKKAKKRKRGGDEFDDLFSGLL